MAAESASVRTTFRSPLNASSQVLRKIAPDRGEPSLQNTLMSLMVGFIPASLYHDMNSEAAYFRAEARGWVPGPELEDWLAAELEMDNIIKAGYRY